MDTERMLEKARSMHAQGLLAEAEALYRELLRSEPNSAEAIESLGVLLYQLGRFGDAVAQFGRGVEIDPRSPRLHAKLGAAYRRLGQFDQARTHLEQATTLDPELPDPWNSLGLLAFDQRRYADAEAAYRRAMRQAPQFAPAYKNLGHTLLALRRWSEAAEVLRSHIRIEPNDPRALTDLGQALGEQNDPDLLEEAEAACRRAVTIAPAFADALDNLGNILRVRGRLEEAVFCYQRALQHEPRRAASRRLIGHVLQHCGRGDEAARFYEAALALEPNDPRIHSDLGSLAALQGNFEQSAYHYQTAVTIDPDFVAGHLGRGQALMELARLDEAEACSREALRLDPTLASPWVTLARIQSERGDFDLACQSARAALVLQPRLVEAYWRLAITLKGRLPDVEVEAMEGLIGRDDLPDRDRAMLHFGLGAVYDARGRYDQAATHVQTANAVQAAVKSRDGIRRDADDHADFTDRSIASFTRDFFARTRGWGDPDPRPVFVVGLPRSGTTLVEQILASHPEVFGAGELQDVMRIVEGLPHLVEQPRIDAFEALMRLTPSLARAAAGRYLDRLQREAPPSAARIVDKMPDNARLLGFIALLWPGAHVIICNRDLRDIAVSCWLAGFETNPWTNNWDMLAWWFADHDRVMRHWRRTRPVDMLEICYEDLVSDLEGEARRLLDFLGLEWDAAVLDFHTNRRVVRTASLVQVRQPINTRSVGRWKSYEAHLGPLRQAFERNGFPWPSD